MSNTTSTPDTLAVIAQLRANAEVLLGPTGEHVPLAATAGALQMAANELERADSERFQAVSKLRALVNHWNEFGPDFGLEGTMHLAGEWLQSLG